MGLIGGVAGELECEVRLDGDVDVDRAARVIAPAASLGPLRFANVVGRLAHLGIVVAIEERHQEDEFGFEDRVPLQFPAPMAVGILQGEQTAPRSLQGGVQAESLQGRFVRLAGLAKFDAWTMLGVAKVDILSPIVTD